MSAKVHKYVNALPDPLEADSIYFLRKGNGFVTVITTAAGVPVSPLYESIKFDRGVLSANQITAGQDVNDNGVVAFTSSRKDDGWDDVANTRQYTGSPDRVRISCTVHQRIADNANIQRPAPQLRLLKNGTVIATSSSGYIRDISDHEDSSNTIAIVDDDPGTDPAYSLQSVQESTNGGVVLVVIGRFDLEAIEVISKDVLLLQ